MIGRGDPSVSKNEALPYYILITKICQRAGVEFPVNSFFLEPMGPIDASSWNQSQGKIKGALVLRRKCAVVERRANLVKVAHIQL